MSRKKLSSEQQFIRNLLIGFFTALFFILVLAMIALFQTLITYPSDPKPPKVTIQGCYHTNTFSTIEGENIRLACIPTLN